MPTKPTPEHRSAFVQFCALPTRWMDNDIYGHVNNVVYHSLFDTAVNQYLIEAGVLDIASGDVVGYVVDVQCLYFAPITFPDVVHVGLRVGHIGTSSVRFELGVFRNDDDVAAAHGRFVHVYVDRITQRPVPMPAPLRDCVTSLVRPGAAPT